MGGIGNCIIDVSMLVGNFFQTRHQPRLTSPVVLEHTSTTSHFGPKKEGTGESERESARISARERDKLTEGERETRLIITTTPSSSLASALQAFPLGTILFLP